MRERQIVHRGKPQDRMHCPYGHPYEGDNLIEMKVKQGGVYTGKVKRQCRQCKRNSHKSAKGKHRKPSLAQAAE